MSLGVREHDTDEFPAMLLPDLVKVHLVEVEISFEALEVFRKEGHFGDKISGRRSWHLLEGDALAAGQKQELGRNVLAIGAGMVRIDEIAVELVRFGYIRNKNRDAGDAENVRAPGRFFLGHGGETEEHAYEQRCELLHSIHLRD